MRLKSPELIIPEEDPYHFDEFNRKTYGDSLYNLFHNLEDNIVVCLDAPWGEGKTTFIEMWLQDLKNKGINCIYYDAYSNDYYDDPFITFTSEIITLSEEEFSDATTIQDSKKNFKEKAVHIATNILFSGTKIGLKALSAGLVDYSDIENLKKVAEDESDCFLSKYLEDKINSYQEKKESIIAFRDILSTLGEEIRNKQDFPLVIIIDELDRCRPDYAILLLERIKHLFSVENVSFLILTNLTQLKNYVETIYGSKIDAHNYLHKFFTITTAFPVENKKIFSSSHKNFFQKLCKHHGIPELEDLSITSLTLFKHLNFSLREIERHCSILALFYSNEQHADSFIPATVTFVAILKVKYNDLFKSLKHGSLTFKKLNDSLKLNLIITEENRKLNIDWFLNMLKYFLLDDEEFKAADVNIKNFIGFYSETQRKYEMPQIADNMDRHIISQI